MCGPPVTQRRPGVVQPSGAHVAIHDAHTPLAKPRRKPPLPRYVSMQSAITIYLVHLPLSDTFLPSSLLQSFAKAILILLVFRKCLSLRNSHSPFISSRAWSLRRPLSHGRPLSNSAEVPREVLPPATTLISDSARTWTTRAWGAEQAHQVLTGETYSWEH